MRIEDGLEVLYHGILIIDYRGNVITCNKAGRELLNIDGQESCYTNTSQFMPDLEIKQVLETGLPIFNNKISLKGKTLIANYTPVKNGETITGVAISFQDITDLDVLASELESTKELYKELEAIFDSSYDEIYVTDGEGYTLRVNKASERLYGLDANKIIGKHVSELEKDGLFSPSITPQVLKEKKRVTLMQTTKNRQKIIVTANPVFDEKGNIIRVVTNSRDITELVNLKQRLEETEKLIDTYRCELAQLRKERLGSEKIIARSTTMKPIFDLVDKVASVESTVLIEGESGVGKGVIASNIHQLSKMSNGPFITINCGAIPENLIESELFGYESGSFTGAKREGKKGLIELANGGTIFFDEIGELPLNLQVKLLHVIQEKKLMRIGGNHYIDVDIRIIAATNRDLQRLIQERKFREDLYYRLNVVPLVIPPLRHRKEDILPMAQHFLDSFNQKYGLRKKFTGGIIEILEKYQWPGNVRELENLVERLVVTSDVNEISPFHLPEHFFHSESNLNKIVVLDVCNLRTATEEVERQILRKALLKYRSTYKMAKALEVNQSTIVRKLHRYKLLDESEKT